MFEIIPQNKKFHFSQYFKLTAFLSGGAVLACLFLVFFGKGLNYGVDFRGGAEFR